MDIEQMLKAHDLKVTPQRKAILTAMESTDAFLSAQELFIEVTDRKSVV